MTDEDLLSTLLRHAQASEGYEVRHFQVVRNGRELQVTLLDSGLAAGVHRYMVEVTDAPDIDLDASHSLSNAAATVAEALAGVHRNEFDTRN